jgi:uncharacterized protein (TIGR04222 family)
MSAFPFILAQSLLEMRGPEFLTLYASVAAIAIAALIVVRWVGDPSRGKAPPPLPEEMDPRELAWLRGGLEELVRLSGLELIQRGYIRYRESGDLICSADPPRKRHLSRGLRAMLDLVKDQPTAKELMSKTKQLFAEEDQELAQRAEAEGYLLPASASKLIGTLGGLLAFGLFLLGVVKVIYALNHGRYNVWYLILLTIAATCLCSWLGNVPRLSARGRADLAQAQAALGDLRGRAPSLVDSADPLLILAAGAYGLGILDSTSYAGYRTYYHPPAGSGSSCGSGCSSASSGSSCSSSSSDSGSSGCGGGGGGGCGGCGGGGGD